MGVVSILHTFRNLAHLAVTPGRSSRRSPAAPRGSISTWTIRRVDRVSIEAAADPRTPCATCRRTASRRWRSYCRRRGAAGSRAARHRRHALSGRPAARLELRPARRAALVYPRPEDRRCRRRRCPTRREAIAGVGTDDFAGLRAYQAERLAAPHRLEGGRARGPAAHEGVHRARRVELWLDWNALPAAAGVETRLSCLTRWVLAAEEANVAYGLRLPGCELAAGPRRGPPRRLPQGAGAVRWRPRVTIRSRSTRCSCCSRAACSRPRRTGPACPGGSPCSPPRCSAGARGRNGGTRSCRGAGC